MFFAFNARKATELARALEKALAAQGVEMAHGQALDTLSRMQGFADWNAWGSAMSPRAVDRQLLRVEREHIEGYEGCDYGPEVALLAHTGFELRYARDGELLEYVRVCDPLGREIAYWHYQEWADDPQLVVGAILGALARGRPVTVTKAGRATPGARASKRVPLISEVDFFKVHAVVFADRCYRVEWREEAALAYLGKTGADGYEGWKDRTALFLHFEDDGFVEEASVTVDELNRLKWDDKRNCFVSAESGPWRIFLESEFTGHARAQDQEGRKGAPRSAERPRKDRGGHDKAPRRYEVHVDAVADDGEVSRLGTYRCTAASRKEARREALDALWDDRLDSASCSPRVDIRTLDDDEGGPFTVFVDGGEYDTMDSFSKAWRVARFMLDEVAQEDAHVENARDSVEFRATK